MKGFTPGLFDRLLGVPLRGGRMSVEDMKDAVARDLEALLLAQGNDAGEGAWAT